MNKINVLVVPAENYGSRESFLEEVYTKENDYYNTIFLMRVKSSTSGGTLQWNDAKVYVLPSAENSLMMRFFLNYFFDYRYLLHILRIVRYEKIKIIQVRDLTFPLCVAFLCKCFFGIKIVYQKTFPHELWKIPASIKYKLPSLARFSREFENYILHKLLKYCDAVFPISSLMALDLEKTHGVPAKRIFVMPMGINEDNFKNVKNVEWDHTDAIKAVYNGTLSPHRKLENILKAIEMFKSSRPRTSVLLSFVGGQRGENEALKEIASDLGLREEVRFYGFVDRLEVYRICSRHHFGISYFPDDKMFYDASPTKLVEYLGLGIPVVATNTVAEQVKTMRATGAGVLCGPSPEEMFTAILDMTKNYFQYKKNACAARAYIMANYDYGRFREHIAGIYGQLLR